MESTSHEMPSKESRETWMIEFDERLSDLKQNIDKSEGAWSSRWSEKADQLKAKAAAAKRRFTESDAVTPSAWDELKTGLVRGWEEVRQGFENAHRRWKETGEEAEAASTTHDGPPTAP